MKTPNDFFFHSAIVDLIVHTIFIPIGFIVNDFALL